MAKVIGPLHSTEARGRVDSLVYGTWRGIRFTRTYVAPVFKEPDCRTAQKARVHLANDAWKLLSNDERLQWHNYAQLHPRSDWTGVPIRISGYNAFVSCFTICLRAGGTPADSPPTGVPPYSLLTLTCDQVDNNVVIDWTYQTEPEAHTYVIQILRTGPISLGKQPDRHHASIIAHVGIASDPYVDPLTISGRYGYWAHVVDADTGETTPELQCQLDFVVIPPAPPTGSVHGRLLETPYPPGTPVNNYHVDCGAYNAHSNAQGYFTITGIPPGNYTVAPAATAPPWVPVSKPVTVVSGETAEVGYFLRTAP